jgi:DNA-binding CsgD family transcriptional regulator
MHPEQVRRRAIELCESGLSSRAAAEQLKEEMGTVVPHATIARWACEHGISRPIANRRRVHVPKEAIRMYQSGLRMRDIAERFKLAKETVRKRFREMGVSIRPRGLTYFRLADKRWLESQYRRKGRSAKDIAQSVGCSVLTVHYHLRRHGIPRKRPRKA